MEMQQFQLLRRFTCLFLEYKPNSNLGNGYRISSSYLYCNGYRCKWMCRFKPRNNNRTSRNVCNYIRSNSIMFQTAAVQQLYLLTEVQHLMAILGIQYQFKHQHSNKSCNWYLYGHHYRCQWLYYNDTSHNYGTKRYSNFNSLTNQCRLLWK
jgi:hypothetical protein